MKENYITTLDELRTQLKNIRPENNLQDQAIMVAIALADLYEEKAVIDVKQESYYKHGSCPNCDIGVYSDTDTRFCHNCGQRLCWFTVSREYSFKNLSEWG